MNTPSEVFFRDEDGELFSAESSADQNSVVTTAVEKVEEPVAEETPTDPTPE